MSYDDTDLRLGGQIVRILLEPDAKPPQVKRQYRSLGRLHAELAAHGMKLIEKQSFGPEAGYMLFYRKGNVVVRIKTRGAQGRMRGGQPHLSVILVSGRRSTTDIVGRPTHYGAILTDYANEEGKFSIHGGVVNKQPRGPYYDQQASPDGKSLGEDWADLTHFVFPDSGLDDSIVDQLVPQYTHRL